MARSGSTSRRTNRRSKRESALRLARRYVWWQPPEETLREPAKLLCQLLELGTAEDYLAARRIWGEDAIREALLTALPGAIGERSRIYWHRYFGLPPRPPPRRRFA